MDRTDRLQVSQLKNQADFDKGRRIAKRFFKRESYPSVDDPKGIQTAGTDAARLYDPKSKTLDTVLIAEMLRNAQNGDWLSELSLKLYYIGAGKNKWPIPIEIENFVNHALIYPGKPAAKNNARNPDNRIRDQLICFVISQVIANTNLKATRSETTYTIGSACDVIVFEYTHSGLSFKSVKRIWEKRTDFVAQNQRSF